MRAIGLIRLVGLLVPLTFFVALAFATKRARSVELEGRELAKSMSGVYRADFESARKSPHTGMILAFFLGSFGAHRFYFGRVGLGLLYLLFCWTMIPGIIGLVEVFLIPARVRSYNAAVATEVIKKQGEKAVKYTDLDLEAVKEALAGRSESLAGRSVRAADDSLIIYQDCDFNSATIGRPVRGTEIQLGAQSEIGGLEWLKPRFQTEIRDTFLLPAHGAIRRADNRIIVSWVFTRHQRKALGWLCLALGQSFSARLGSRRPAGGIKSIVTMPIRYHTSTKFILEDGEDNYEGYIESHNGVDRNLISTWDGNNKIEFPIDQIKQIEFTEELSGTGPDKIVKVTLLSGRTKRCAFCSHMHYFVADDGPRFGLMQRGTDKIRRKS